MATTARDVAKEDERPASLVQLEHPLLKGFLDADRGFDAASRAQIVRSPAVCVEHSRIGASSFRTQTAGSLNASSLSESTKKAHATKQLNNSQTYCRHLLKVMITSSLPLIEPILSHKPFQRCCEETLPTED